MFIYDFITTIETNTNYEGIKMLIIFVEKVEMVDENCSSNVDFLICLHLGSNILCSAVV